MSLKYVRLVLLMLCCCAATFADSKIVWQSRMVHHQNRKGDLTNVVDGNGVDENTEYSMGMGMASRTGRESASVTVATGTTRTPLVVGSGANYFLPQTETGSTGSTLATFSSTKPLMGTDSIAGIAETVTTRKPLVDLDTSVIEANLSEATIAENGLTSKGTLPAPGSLFDTEMETQMRTGSSDKTAVPVTTRKPLAGSGNLGTLSSIVLGSMSGTEMEISNVMPPVVETDSNNMIDTTRKPLAAFGTSDVQSGPTEAETTLIDSIRSTMETKPPMIFDPISNIEIKMNVISPTTPDSIAPTAEAVTTRKPLVASGSLGTLSSIVLGSMETGSIDSTNGTATTRIPLVNFDTSKIGTSSSEAEHGLTSSTMGTTPSTLVGSIGAYPIDMKAETITTRKPLMASGSLGTLSSVVLGSMSGTEMGADSMDTVSGTITTRNPILLT